MWTVVLVMPLPWPSRRRCRCTSPKTCSAKPSTTIEGLHSEFPLMSERNPPSPVDIVFTAVSPALIMLMVGSLVFFLITVLPTGDYKERLLYTTFFFVFGAVLVARIAIQLDAARASIYGLGLAIVTFLAMTAYVDYPTGTTLKSVGWLVNL